MHNKPLKQTVFPLRFLCLKTHKSSRKYCGLTGRSQLKLICTKLPWWPWLSVLTLVGATLLSGCQKSVETASTRETAPPLSPIHKEQSVANFLVWPIGEAMLNEAARAVEQLHIATEQLLDEPKLPLQSAVRDAWFKSLQSVEELYFFTRLADTQPSPFKQLQEVYFRVAAWPVEAGYLDGFAEHPYSGIVFDVGTPLSEELLQSQHGMTSSSEALLGLYAMGVILFGPENERAPLTFLPVTVLSSKDKASGFKTVKELPRNRRRALLELQTTLLVEDIEKLLSLFKDKSEGGLANALERHDPLDRMQLLMNSARAMITKQIIAIGKHRTAVKTATPEWTYWQDQLLALRLRSQLSGWKKVLAILPLDEKEPLFAQVEFQLAALTQLLEMPPTGNTEPNSKAWGNIYQALRKHAATIENAEPEK